MTYNIFGGTLSLTQLQLKQPANAQRNGQPCEFWSSDLVSAMLMLC